MGQNNNLVLPIALGVGSFVALSAIVAGVRGKRRRLVTLVNPNTVYKLKIIEKEAISPDTRRFRLALPTPQHVLGLYVGGHITISADINGENVSRAYTPINSDSDKGYVDLVIKVYYKNVHPKFPAGGKLTQYLDTLNVGDTCDVKGPVGKKEYTSKGTFYINRPNSKPYKVTFKKLNMIAGGTGIAPMLQQIRQTLTDPNDDTQLRLIFANKSEDDILLRDHLEAFQTLYPDQFKVWYTLDKASPDWKYSTGFVSEEMIRDHLFPPADDVFVYMCGPRPMMTEACKPALEKLGYKKEMWFP